jgi:hypothetical protein
MIFFFFFFFVVPQKKKQNKKKLQGHARATQPDTAVKLDKVHDHSFCAFDPRGNPQPQRRDPGLGVLGVRALVTVSPWARGAPPPGRTARPTRRASPKLLPPRSFVPSPSPSSSGAPRRLAARAPRYPASTAAYPAGVAPAPSRTAKRRHRSATTGSPPRARARHAASTSAAESGCPSRERVTRRRASARPGVSGLKGSSSGFFFFFFFFFLY